MFTEIVEFATVKVWIAAESGSPLPDSPGKQKYSSYASNFEQSGSMLDRFETVSVEAVAEACAIRNCPGIAPFNLAFENLWENDPVQSPQSTSQYAAPVIVGY